MSNPCRILDDDELEKPQWRINTSELKIHRIFGSEAKTTFPSAFQNNTKTQKASAFFPIKRTVQPKKASEETKK
jgi:hypothetical protein